MRKYSFPSCVSITTIAIMCLTLWLSSPVLAGNVLTVAAQVEWKTYLNPVYKFSFVYPHSNITSIMEAFNYSVIVGDSDSAESLFRLEIIPKNGTHNLTSIVEADKNRTLGNMDLNYSLFQDVKSVSYPQVNLTGYEYIVFSEDSDLMTRDIFLSNDQLEYFLFFDSGLSRYDYSKDTWIDKTINSLKFFE